MTAVTSAAHLLLQTLSDMHTETTHQQQQQQQQQQGQTIRTKTQKHSEKVADTPGICAEFTFICSFHISMSDKRKKN